MEFDIEVFKNEYIDYLKNSLNSQQLGEYYELTLPFYDRFNDSLQIYIKQNSEDEFLISDDAYIINSLEDTGLKITSKRLDQIKNISSKLGVSVNEKNIEITASKKELIPKVHSIVQTMLRIDDMYLTAQNKVASYFVEDVSNYFINNDIYYSQDVGIIGKSGMTQLFDFLFQRNKTHSERLCKTLNKASKSNVINTIFAWEDIEDVRKDSKMLVIMNDANKIDKGVIEAMTKYDITSIKWSEISDNLELFQ